MSDSPTKEHPKNLRRLWDTFELDGYEISYAAAMMMLALDDLKNARSIDVHYAVAVWRRYCASNLTEREWGRKAWRRGDADKHGARALRELSEGLNLVSHGRIHPTSHHLVAKVRERFAAAMLIPEFIRYATATYEKKSGKFAD